MESVSTVFLIDLALDLSGDWVKLARALGLEDQVERIRRDNEKNVREQAYRLLLTWKQSHGTRATLELLYEALRKPTVSRVDLAEKYCENYNQGSSKAGKRFRNFENPSSVRLMITPWQNDRPPVTIKVFKSLIMAGSVIFFSHSGNRMTTSNYRMSINCQAS